MQKVERHVKWPYNKGDVRIMGPLCILSLD